ncbi:MAG TPA: gamma-glutamyltransferase [Actinomycetota bacterium]|nr:gamma-glutamyltransferase [Actinomycetota bacterium]
MGSRLAIAAGNKAGVEAATSVALAGGNAVDACLASAIMAWVAEPFFASVAGSGFIAVRDPSGTVDIIDGNVAMPRSVPDAPGQGIRRVFLDYSNGMYTGAGGGAVAVPGVLAAIRTAWERHGRIEWAALFEPAIAIARDGFAFPTTSAYYLSVTWEGIWSQHAPTASLFTDADGRRIAEGEQLYQTELAEALSMIATQGPGAFYSGEIGRAIAETIVEDGGFMTLDDLAAYNAEVRIPLRTSAFGLTIDTNPPPAVGGVVLTHMLSLLDGAPMDEPEARLSSIIEAGRAAMAYRQEQYQDPEGIASAFEHALKTVRRVSPETTHSSAADSDGYACAVTESNGYGAGLSAHGILLNNSLGEEELNPLGTHALPPGARCHSNMAPTIAQSEHRTIALGSPGADRIVTAIAQTLIRIGIDGDDLGEAVAAPRAHLDSRPDGERLCYEPGLPGEALDYPTIAYDGPHMYFGGVQAAAVDDSGRVTAAHDPRRSGGSQVIVSTITP